MWFIGEPKADFGHTILSPSSLLRTWVTRQSKTSLVFWAFSDIPKEFHNPFPAVTTWHILHPVEWYFSHYLPRRQTRMRFVGKAKMDENTGRKWETHWRFERTLRIENWMKNLKIRHHPLRLQVWSFSATGWHCIKGMTLKRQMGFSSGKTLVLKVE